MGRAGPREGMLQKGVGAAEVVPSPIVDLREMLIGVGRSVPCKLCFRDLSKAE